MNFLHPGLAMAAVAAATIPVLLHLLLRRPRATPWPSNMLLQRAIDRLRRRRDLDRWMLLAMRVLSILLVGLGMAGPFLSSQGGAQGSRTVWIVLDDGATSAERLEDGGTSLDRSRLEAIRTLDGLGESDRAALVLAGRPVSVMVQPTIDVSRVRRAVMDTATRPVPTDLPAAMSRAVPPEDSTGLVEVTVLSGWRRGSIRGAEMGLQSLAAGARRVKWIALPPIAGNSANRRIEQALTGRSTQGEVREKERPIRVRLARTTSSSMQDEGLQVSLPGGEIVSESPIAWKPGMSTIDSQVTIRNATAGGCTVSVPTDAQPLDDSRAVVWEPRTMPRVWIVGRGESEGTSETAPSTLWTSRAIESGGVETQIVDPASMSLRPQGNVDTIILCRPDLVDAAGWTWLARFTDDGGTLLLMPCGDPERQPWIGDAGKALGVDLSDSRPLPPSRLAPRQPRSGLLSMLGAEIDQLAEPVTMSRRLDLSRSAAQGETILQFDDGRAALVMARREFGIVLLLAMSIEIDWTDLPLKPLVVPLLQEVVRSGLDRSTISRQILVGELATLGRTAAGGTLSPANAAMGTVIEIDGEGRPRNPVTTPGLWKLRRKDGTESWIAAILDPSAADVSMVRREDLAAWERVLGDWRWTDTTTPPPTGSEPSESPWTRILLVVGLLCLVVETPWSRRGSPRRSMQAVAA